MLNVNSDNFIIKGASYIIRTHINKLEERLSSIQLVFRNELGTWEALFGLQTLTPRCHVNYTEYASSVKFEQYFNKFQNQKLLETLQISGIDNKGVRIISNLYCFKIRAEYLLKEVCDRDTYVSILIQYKYIRKNYLEKN